MLCKAEDVDEYELPSKGGVVLGTVTGVFIAKKASTGERQAVVSIGDDLPDAGKWSEEQYDAGDNKGEISGIEIKSVTNFFFQVRCYQRLFFLLLPAGEIKGDVIFIGCDATCCCDCHRCAESGDKLFKRSSSERL